ncbi:MAG: glycoside hydrolase family 38 C-terminal domain-containing protein, partial [Verrucomicrobiota bacterium]
MFPQNPFLQLTLPRAVKAIARVEAQIWSEIEPVDCAFGGAFEEPVSFDKAKKLAFRPIRLPFHWGKVFDQGWFRLKIPAEKSREPLYLHWNDQGEGTAYIDGVPFYGFDVAHRYCALPHGTREVFVEGLCLQSAIWHPAATGLKDPRGSCLSGASLARRNQLAWEVFHDLRVLFGLAMEEGKSSNPANPPHTGGVGYRAPIENVSVLYRRLLRALDDAVNALDQGGLAAMKTSLRKAYQSLAGQNERISAVLTGHAHIDLVWLWPERSSEYKAVHTFSTMDRLMDLYPEFVFGYSQPASYDAVERISPALMKRVKSRVKSGRWEPVGATEVESDTLMACGEALARSFLIGQNGYRKIQGRPSPVLWIPDVFGYCASLPQIMLQTGVEYFFTTKLTWSNINLFPYSSFIWRGNDGSEVLVHVTQENGYNQAVSAEELRRGARAYRQSDVHDEFLAPTGFGDGGGGVTEEMCERARRMKSLAGLPEVGWGRVEDFFKRLDRKRAKLPKYQGELYLEYHRGVLTTHGDLKAQFRATERALQTWEAARCATAGGTIPEEPWKRTVFAQFHDYIPGSSIWEVYEEGLAELKSIADNALDQAKHDLGKGAKPGVFNPLPIERIVVLQDGEKAVRLGPLSGGAVASLPAIAPVAEVTASSKKLTSGLVSAAFDAKGRISSLAFGANKIPARGPLGDIVVYPDVPHAFEAWDIDRQTLSLGSAVETVAKATVLAGGALERSVEFRRKLGTGSEMTVSYRLDAFQPVLHIAYEIEWHEQQTLLKALFPTAFDGRMARFGAPFG